MEFRFKCDNVYNKLAEGCIRYEVAGVERGELLNGIEPVLGENNMTGSTLETSDNQFVYIENCKV